MQETNAISSGYFKGLKKYSCLWLLMSSRLEDEDALCSCAQFGCFMETIVLLQVIWAGEGTLVLVMWLVLIFSLVACCAYSPNQLSMGPFVDETRCYSKEEAQQFFDELDDLELGYNQRIICKKWNKQGDDGEAFRVVHNEEEELEYADSINVSQKVDIEKCQNVSHITIYIEKEAEVADSVSATHFDDLEKAFVDPKKNLGTYYKYERFLTNTDDVPEYIVVCKKTPDGKPIIPWYYNNNNWLNNFCDCCIVQYCWRVFAETVLSTSYAYYNRRVFSSTTIEPELKQRIERIREENKFTL